MALPLLSGDPYQVLERVKEFIGFVSGNSVDWHSICLAQFLVFVEVALLA